MEASEFYKRQQELEKLHSDTYKSMINAVYGEVKSTKPQSTRKQPATKKRKKQHTASTASTIIPRSPHNLVADVYYIDQLIHKQVNQSQQVLLRTARVLVSGNVTTPYDWESRVGCSTYNYSAREKTYNMQMLNQYVGLLKKDDLRFSNKRFAQRLDMLSKQIAAYITVAPASDPPMHVSNAHQMEILLSGKYIQTWFQCLT